MRRRACVIVMVLATLSAASARAATPAAGTGADAYRFVTTYARLGLHRTGTAGNDATAAWLANEFRSIRLQTSVQHFTFERFLPKTAELRVGAFSPTVFPLYYSGTTTGVRGELVDVGFGTPLDLLDIDLTGKIALVEVPMPVPGLAPTLSAAIKAVTGAHAAGMVAAIDGPRNDISVPDVDARSGTCRLPVLLTGERSGAALRARAGHAASLVLDASVARASASNVIGVLPGTSQDVLVVGTPITGWFSAASERGAGIGVMLTLARQLARRGPQRQTVMFLGTSGHEVGFLGLQRFVQANPKLLPHITAYLHLGAAPGVKGDIEIDDRIVQLERQAPLRLLTVSESALLGPMTWGSALANGVLASPAPQGVGASGEEVYMYNAGVPTMALKSIFLWIHTRDDVASTTSPGLLDPVVRMYSQLADDLLGLDPGLGRSANQPASLIASHMPALPVSVGLVGCAAGGR